IDFELGPFGLDVDRLGDPHGCLPAGAGVRKYVLPERLAALYRQRRRRRPRNASGVRQPHAVPDLVGLRRFARISCTLTLLLVERVADLPLVRVLVRHIYREQRVVASLAFPERDAPLLVEEQVLARLAIERGRWKDGRGVAIRGSARLLNDHSTARPNLTRR